MKNQMTIHRALSELKLIDAKINKQITNLRPTGISQEGKLVNGLYEKKDFDETAKKGYQRIMDLILRKALIKTAIVKSNARTIVKVANIKMSVADAISEKDIVNIKKTVVNDFTAKHRTTLSQLENKNAVVDENCQRIVNTALGKDNVDIDSRAAVNIAEPYLKANKFILIDPLDIEKELLKIQEQIDEFISEVDAVLSESNAITLIEI